MSLLVGLMPFSPQHWRDEVLELATYRDDVVSARAEAGRVASVREVLTRLFRRLYAAE